MSLSGGGGGDDVIVDDVTKETIYNLYTNRNITQDTTFKIYIALVKRLPSLM